LDPKSIVLNGLQCDTVWAACVYLGAPTAAPSNTPSVIANIAQKCSGVANVWPTYYGVELAVGALGAAISNVAEYPSCQFVNTQLVHYDTPPLGANPQLDASVQVVSQSPGAQFCSPSVGYASGRYYTTPFTASSPSPVSADTLYAIPVQIRCTVSVKTLSTYVAAATGQNCRYGIYANNGMGQPGARILDAGPIAVTGTNVTASITLSTPQQLSPGLVFLAVVCDATTPPPPIYPMLTSGSTMGTPTGTLIGLAQPNDTSAVITSDPSSPVLPSAPLPSSFPTPVVYSTSQAPLVFFTPP
jgi:hypothetical protein